jgi:hypothetical protein
LILFENYDNMCETWMRKEEKLERRKGPDRRKVFGVRRKVRREWESE